MTELYKRISQEKAKEMMGEIKEPGKKLISPGSFYYFLFCHQSATIDKKFCF